MKHTVRFYQLFTIFTLFSCNNRREILCRIHKCSKCKLILLLFLLLFFNILQLVPLSLLVLHFLCFLLLSYIWKGIVYSSRNDQFFRFGQYFEACISLVMSNVVLPLEFKCTWVIYRPKGCFEFWAKYSKV